VDCSTRKYTVSHFESCDWDWDSRFTNTTRIRYLRIYLDGAPFLDQSAQLGASLGEKEADFMKVEHDVEVPIDSVLRVEEGSSKIMSARHLETRMISEPTMDLRLYVLYPKDLKVDIELPHVLLGGENFRQVSNETVREGKQETYWHVSRPVAPLTFFNIVWRKNQQSISTPKRPVTAPAPSPTASPPDPAAATGEPKNCPASPPAKST
jgi:hypothetical protein